MDPLDKSAILMNVGFLVSSTKYEELMDACLQYPPSDGKIFFSKNMKQEIENRHQSVADRHFALFQKITQRGPNAYNILIEILKSKKFNTALDKLKDTNTSIRNNLINTNSNHNNNNTPRNHRRPSTNPNFKPSSRNEPNSNEDLPLVPEVFEPESLNGIILQEADVQYLNPKIEAYPMTKRKKGVLFLVNITKFEFDLEKERRGSEHDTINLMNLFGKLDFEVFKYEDITKSQFQSLLTRLLDSDYCQQAQCFVMALMSHGQMIDRKTAYVNFYDNQREEVHNIMDNFNNKSCKTLVKKPKILLFPFCRGDSIDIGVPDERNDETEQDALLMSNPNLPTFSDMLICYGSLPGFVANREPSEGSWYINALYDVFIKNACDTHIEDMLKMVGPRIVELYGYKTGVSRQTPVFWNYSFNKYLYFNPGKFNE